MVKSILSPLGWNEDEEPLCIAFANTVGSRRSEQPNEYLSTPTELARFVEKRGLGSPSIDNGLHREAIALRDAIYRTFSAVAAGRKAGESSLDLINVHLHQALDQVGIDADGWTLSPIRDAERFLMLAALSAAELLTSERVMRVRECADPECGWLFIDSSKNRSRRWCSMSDCGNLAKARRFQAKKRGQFSS